LDDEERRGIVEAANGLTLDVKNVMLPFDGCDVPVDDAGIVEGFAGRATTQGDNFVEN
jgi:hypothetical protein